MSYQTPTMTLYVQNTRSTGWSTSRTTPTATAAPTTTQHHLQIRADSSSSSSHSSSKHSTSQCTDKQRCTTGQNMNGLTVGLAVALPVFFFSCLIGAFIIRSYRKSKKENAEDHLDDPDFYGETTVLPNYPRKVFDQTTMNDSGSLYSTPQNPFGGDNNRYPSGAFTARSMSNMAPSINTMQQPHTDYHGFSLPYQQNMGSKHSLDEYARNIGSEYQAYQLADAGSRPTSRVPSRTHSPYLSPISSQLDVIKRNERILTEKEHETTDSSNSYPDNEEKFRQRTLKELERPVSDHVEDGNDQEEDDDDPVQSEGYAPHDERPLTQYEDAEDDADIFTDQPSHQGGIEQRRQSVLSFVDNEPETLNKKSVGFDTQEPHPGLYPEDDDNIDKKDIEEEDDENIKRMKSVYRVYFDRENSIKSKKSVYIEDDEEAPPLPVMDDLDHDINAVVSETKAHQPDEDEFHPEAESTAIGDISREQEHQQTVTENTVSVPEPAQKKHRVVSSVYSTIPLQYGQYQQEHDYQGGQYNNGYHQQQPPMDPYQQQKGYYQQPQQNIYQPPRSYSTTPSSRYQAPEEPLSQLPTASKIDYGSVVSNNQYAPTKSLTGGTRPPNLTVKAFNPLHYSDQIFSPTSPQSPASSQFNSMPPQFGKQDNSAAPPSPHHIRQSIVMVDPVEIGKQKIYRPAGAFSQMNSANSSRAGSLTSQSVYNPPAQLSSDTHLPHSGSQSDLRKQLGGSENYNFV